MSAQSLPAAPSFFARLWMALVCFFAIAFRPRFAQAVLPAYRARKALPAGGGAPVAQGAPAPKTPAPKARAETPPEKAYASALFVLSALQREGRLIDFLQENITPFSDAEVGAAARVVHEGCRKVLTQYLALEPVLKDAEGAKVTVPQGFDADRIRLTGNVSGKPPFLGALKHHGWVTQAVRFPTLSESLDPRVLAPAEVELS